MKFEDLGKMADQLFVHGTDVNAPANIKLKRFVNGMRDRVALIQKGDTLFIDLDLLETECRKNRVTHYLLTLTPGEYEAFLKKIKIQPSRPDVPCDSSKQPAAFIDWHLIDQAIDAGVAWGSRKFCGGRWIEGKDAEEIHGLNMERAERAERYQERCSFVQKQKADGLSDKEIADKVKVKFPEHFGPKGNAKDLGAYLNGEIN